MRIFDSEPSYNKRLISKMVHIEKQRQDLNKQNGYMNYFFII